MWPSRHLDGGLLQYHLLDLGEGVALGALEEALLEQQIQAVGQRLAVEVGRARQILVPIADLAILRVGAMERKHHHRLKELVQLQSVVALVTRAVAVVVVLLIRPPEDVLDAHHWERF